MKVTLVARDLELAAAVRSLREGRGTMLVGEAGVGKTALAAAVSAELARGGQPTSWVVAIEAGRREPFCALGSLLPEDVHTVHPALVPNLVLRRLQEVGGGRCPVLVVDDAQLLDDQSAAALLALVAAGTVRLLATARAAAGPDAVVALWKDRLLDRLDLGPLDRDATRALLADRLGGEVASATVRLLWERAGGNPLYLTELVHFGLTTGRLRLDTEIWWWSGAADVPPRLGELLQRRLDAVSPPARDALDLLALGEPLPYDTLTALVPPGALLEIDEQGLAVAEERDGLLAFRFAHPLLRAAATRRLSAPRRRALADRLRAAPAAHVDLLRRASWELAAADPPDTSLLLAAADAVLLAEPRQAMRLAERAIRHHPGPRAAITLANAHAEVGEAARARELLGQAAERVASAQDRLAVGLSDLSLTLWSERRPSAALERLARLRTELPGEYADELDSAQALVTLFSGRPAQALALADRVLAQHVRRSAFIRATTTRLAALVVDDRPEEALAAGRRVTACLDAGTTSPYQGGLADAVIGTARLFGEPDAALPPALGSFGRWPVLAAADGQALGPAWPLLEGVRRHLAGDWPAAVVALREAFVQQQAGEGLFRSEAAGGLIVVLAECGRVAEAARLLAEHPPDGVALIPGMREWAAAAVAAASPAGGAAALEAARLALDAGALTTAMWYLADAARYGAARQAAELLDGLPARSELSRVRAAGIRARATRRPAALAGAAREHLRLGLFGHAAELADLAGNHEGATELVAEAQARLGRADRDGSPLARLTGREREVARLAAGGLTDREIADSLVVSVRTVESHLSSAYRKLGIRSRRALRETAGAHRDG